VLLVDQNGVPDLSPGVERSAGGRTAVFPVLGAGAALTSAGFLAGNIPLAIAAATVCGGVLLAGVVRPTLARNRVSREVGRAIERAGSVTEIARASGYARIRGRVRVLDPVADPYGRLVGAFVARKVVGVGGRVTAAERDELETFDLTPIATDGDGMAHVHKGAVTEQSSRCGRFLVSDETGVAVVDDDAFDVWVADDCPAPTGHGFSIAAVDGAIVEIVGPCRERPAADDERRTEAGYRERPTVLAFDGQPGDRVLILTTLRR
jgi:hypothetical protein